MIAGCDGVMVGTACSDGSVADFCAQLARLRAESKIPVAVLARHLGVSRQHLYEVLGGRVRHPPAWDPIVGPLVKACTNENPAMLTAWQRRHEALSEARRFESRPERSGPVADFCAGLREMRAESEIPVAVLARRLGVSRQHLYEVLAGRVRRLPDWDTLVRPLVEACTARDPAAVMAWRRRHALMTAAWDQLTRNSSGAQPTGAVAGVRSSLPPDTAAFTGREHELKLISAAVAEAAASDGGVAIRVIDGMPGVGKTALAVRAAHLLASDFPDRQLFVDLHGHTVGREPVTPADALAGLLTAIGADARYVPPDEEGRSALWRDRMAGQRAVVVLDNAASSAQVLPLLPGAAGCLVLVTSRRHLADLPGTVVPVAAEALPDGEAVRMFTRLAPRAEGDDPAAVAELTRMAGSLPLAVSLLARAYARHRAWSLADLAAEARAHPLTMKAEQFSVAAAFEVSLAHIEPERQRFFGCLGLHPGPSFDARAAASLAAVSVAEAETLLDSLHGEGLLTETAWRRYGMHDLIRQYARDRVALSMTGRERVSAVGRLLDYYQHTAGRAQALTTPLIRGSTTPDRAVGSVTVPELTDDQGAMAWLRAERANLLACLDYVTGQQMPERLVALTAGISGLIRRDGPWPETVIRHERAAQAALELTDKPGLASALLSLADGHWLTGDFRASAQAATRALVLFGELGDQLGEANASVVLADTHRLTADYPAASRLLERALRIFGELDDRLGQAQALTSLGLVRRVTGDPAAAAAAAQQALSLSRELRRHREQAQALALLGDLRRDAGDYRAAIAAAEQAIELYREVGERCGQAGALCALGAAHRAAGHYPEAVSALARALGIWKDVGNRYWQASSLLYLGAVGLHEHDYAHAAAQMDEALRILLEHGDRGGAAEAYSEIGSLHLARGDLIAARRAYRQALDLARQIGSPVDEGTALAGLGRCARGTRTATHLLAQAHRMLHDNGAVAAADAIAGALDTPLAGHGTGRRPGALANMTSEAI